ncbi:unnamed protein product [Adineta steineri]|uniref:Uncharacterized protein n=1 Tax=Adineta steineri TaxID=433720 RepID=A0A813MMS1_9BILA|nr:unnamed protein product [Adineta steineri]CAF0754504.1 unnamed protein product [Adineta steineri]CAF0834682.1 unnamed protein product [Adineta steineri]
MTSDLNVEAWRCTMLTPQISQVVLVDNNHFMNYLNRICSFMLNSCLNSIDINQSFIDKVSCNSVQRFISYDQCQSLPILKIHSTSECSSSLFNLRAQSNEDCEINSNHLSFILRKRNEKFLFGVSSDDPRVILPDIILTAPKHETNGPKHESTNLGMSSI